MTLMQPDAAEVDNAARAADAAGADAADAA